MDNSTRAALAAGLAAGYVVGRTKKGKLALGLVSLAAGRSLDPAALIGQGVSKLAENPQFAQLTEQVRGQLPGSARSALSEVTNRGVASLTSSLQQRTSSLLDSETDGETEEEDQEVWDEDEEPEEDEEEEEPESPRSSRRRPAKKATAEKPTARKPGPRNPPAKKAMARKAADRKGTKRAPSKRAEARTARRSGRR